MMDCVKTFWALEYVNAHWFIGRAFGHWTRASHLDVAVLFDSENEAESARQAMFEEAVDRMKTDRARSSGDFWFNVYGGRVDVVEVEQIMRLRKPQA